MKLEKIIQDAMVNDPIFSEILEIVKANTRGKIWVAGGFIFRHISAHLYGTPIQIKDYDFVVEELIEIKTLPVGWNVVLNTFGGPKIEKGNLGIDMIPLDKMYAVTEYGFEPTIDTYLNRVSLTIQSLAYDLGQNKLIGKMGISALLTKTIAINNKEQLMFYLDRKKITLEEYMKSKVPSLEFQIIIS